MQNNALTTYYAYYTHNYMHDLIEIMDDNDADLHDFLLGDSDGDDSHDDEQERPVDLKGATNTLPTSEEHQDFTSKADALQPRRGATPINSTTTTSFAPHMESRVVDAGDNGNNGMKGEDTDLLTCDFQEAANLFVTSPLNNTRTKHSSLSPLNLSPFPFGNQ